MRPKGAALIPHIRRGFWFVLVIAICAIPLKVQAHTTAEIEEWFEEWKVVYEEAWVEWVASGEWELSAEVEMLVIEYVDMKDRHPEWEWDKPPRPSNYGRSFPVDPVPPPPSPPPSPPPTSELEPEPSPEPEAEVIEEPEPKSPPTTVPPSYGSGVEQWRGLVEAYFGDETSIALCIMDIESGGDPTAVNPSSGAAGLFQFIPSTWNNMIPDLISGAIHDSVFDPEINVKAAIWLRNAEGWSQWAPWNRGECH